MYSVYWTVQGYTLILKSDGAETWGQYLLSLNPDFRENYDSPLISQITIFSRKCNKWIKGEANNLRLHEYMQPMGIDWDAKKYRNIGNTHLPTT